MQLKLILCQFLTWWTMLVLAIVVIMHSISELLEVFVKNTDLNQDINGCVQTGGKSDLNQIPCQIRLLVLTVHTGLVDVSVHTGPHC